MAEAQESKACNVDEIWEFQSYKNQPSNKSNQPSYIVRLDIALETKISRTIYRLDSDCRAKSGT